MRDLSSNLCFAAIFCSLFQNTILRSVIRAHPQGVPFTVNNGSARCAEKIKTTSKPVWICANHDHPTLTQEALQRAQQSCQPLYPPPPRIDMAKCTREVARKTEVSPYFKTVYASHNVHVLDDRRIVIFALPKVMSTTLRLTFGSKAKRLDARVHGKHFWAVVVRDPMSRLRSAYKDLDRNRFIRRTFFQVGQQEGRFFCMNTQMCTFDQFVHHVHRLWVKNGRKWAGSKVFFDDHIQPQVYLLGVPRVKYDFVGIFEAPADMAFFYRYVLNTTDIRRNSHDSMRPQNINGTMFGQCCASSQAFCCPVGVQTYNYSCTSPSRLAKEQVEEMYAGDYRFIRGLSRTWPEGVTRADAGALGSSALLAANERSTGLDRDWSLNCHGFNRPI